jgi:tetratricopeptide (TPR) repeat protein
LVPQPEGHAGDESVRHLVELGYVDPDEVAAREAARRRELEVRLRQAVELRRQGRDAQSLALVEELTRDDPDWISPRQVLVELHYAAGRWAEAQVQLDWLAYHGIEHPRFALIAGGIKAARREFRAALEELHYARHVDPNLGGVHILLGTVQLRLGRLDEAEDAFRQAAERDPNDAQARDGVAAVCLRHGEYEDAADWALRALEQNIQLFRAHYHLGIALAFLNRFDEAIRALETAAKIDPSRAAPYFWLSQIAKSSLNDPERSAQYRNLGREKCRQRRQRRQRQ